MAKISSHNSSPLAETELNYWNQSRTPFYSFLFVIPLILIYEAGILLLSHEDVTNLRNGADVLMRQVMGSFGLLGIYGFGLVFLLGFALIWVFQIKSRKVKNFNSSYLMGMFFESLAWGGLLFLILRGSQSLLMFTNGNTLIQQLILAAGAGIYEEFIFRVILITGLATLLKTFLQLSHMTGNITAVILAALLFSAFHFMGNFGDVFDFRLLMVRTLAGVVLGAIYIMRGFGITAYSHAFYDMIVLTVITTA